jgi:signal peptide peptidase SppA
MAHELMRLTQRLCNKPQLISQAALASVVHILEQRNAGNYDMRVTDKKVEPRYPAYNKEKKVGLLQIEGALTNIAYEGICGETGCSYESLVVDAKYLIEEGAKTIVLDIDSGGGEAYGCFEAANTVRQMADNNGVKIITYVDGMAASAAYAWAIIADEVVANPMAEVGSIGVVMQLLDTSKYHENLGLKRVFVYAGDSKIPFAPDGSFTESFLADLQDGVDFFYNEFIEHVAFHRNISKEQIMGTQAKVFLPSKAAELGLIDKTMLKEEFLDYVFA